MGIKSTAAKWLARRACQGRTPSAPQAIAQQDACRKRLLKIGGRTHFGRDHRLPELPPHELAAFQQAVPLRDYEGLRPWLDRVARGEADICWPGKPIYLAKTSGTTSGAKYIPITKASIGHHIHFARQLLYTYIHHTGDAEWVNHRMLFLSGSPVLEDHHGIPTGRLSGIVNHHIPSYLQRNRLPSAATNCIEDWEEKVEAILQECFQNRLGLISGIPPWVQMLFERITELSGMSVSERFPELRVYAHGGVNFAPYRRPLNELLGPSRRVAFLESYPASEGFIAYQDSMEHDGLLLNTNAGMYFEFVPTDELGSERPRRLDLRSVETGRQYALALSSNAGLWGYILGDTVKFVSTDPFRLVVTGRTKHFTSAFGEHVIAEEVEESLAEVAAEMKLGVREFHVAPVIQPDEGLPHHQWLIELEHEAGEALEAFAARLDQAMQRRNPYYRELVQNGILAPLRLHPLPKGSFAAYMKSVGRLGGQNKPPRLANHRRMADPLLEIAQAHTG
jgi:hypothetical protein